MWLLYPVAIRLSSCDRPSLRKHPLHSLQGITIRLPESGCHGLVLKSFPMRRSTWCSDRHWCDSCNCRPFGVLLRPACIDIFLCQLVGILSPFNRHGARFDQLVFLPCIACLGTVAKVASIIWPGRWVHFNCFGRKNLVFNKNILKV